MKIVNERKSTTFNFSEVAIGEVFFAKDVAEWGESPYMKISAIEDSDYCRLNAVDLGDGQVVRMEDNEQIILCNATLKIY